MAEKDLRFPNYDGSVTVLHAETKRHPSGLMTFLEINGIEFTAEEVSRIFDVVTEAFLAAEDHLYAQTVPVRIPGMMVEDLLEDDVSEEQVKALLQQVKDGLSVPNPEEPYDQGAPVVVNLTEMVQRMFGVRR